MNIDPDAMTVIVEGLTRCMVCAESTYELAFNSMGFIGNVVIIELQHACEAVIQTNHLQQIVRVSSILKVIRQMVRFCDQPPTLPTNLKEIPILIAMNMLSEGLFTLLKIMLTLVDNCLYF